MCALIRFFLIVKSVCTSVCSCADMSIITKKAFAADCIFLVAFVSSSSHRAENHCGCSDPVSEEAVRCDDSDSVLSECICPHRSTAVYG